MWTQNIVVYTARSFFDTHAMTVGLKSFFLYSLILFSLFSLALAAKRTYRLAVIIQFAIVFRPNNSSSFPTITLSPQEQVSNDIFFIGWLTGVSVHFTLPPQMFLRDFFQKEKNLYRYSVRGVKLIFIHDFLVIIE